MTAAPGTTTPAGRMPGLTLFGAPEPVFGASEPVSVGTWLAGELRRGVHLAARLPGLLLLGLLWVYQRLISPLTPPTCRYYPSCSQYAVIAVRRHGALRGTWLAVRRLGRCHPWAAGGVDDVPPVRARHDHGLEHVDRARSSAR